MADLRRWTRTVEAFDTEACVDLVDSQRLFLFFARTRLLERSLSHQWTYPLVENVYNVL